MKSVQITLIFCLIWLASCNSFEDVSDRSEFTGDLILGGWRLDYAAYEDVDVTELLNDFENGQILTLNFDEDGNWIAENAEELFSSGGLWEIDPSYANRLLLGESEIQIDFNFDGTVLNMAFQTNSNVIGGRVDGLSGTYDLSLSKTNIND